MTVVNDTIQIQHLVDYPVLSDGKLDMDNITMQRLYGDELLNLVQPKCGGTTTTWYSYQSCYSIPCIGTGSEKHNYGEPCQLDGQPGGPQLRCITKWASTDVAATSCISSGDPVNGGGGGSGQGSGGSQSDDVDDTTPDDDDPNNDEGANDILIGFDPNDGPADFIEDPNIEEVKKIISDIKFKESITGLRLSLDRPRELGYTYEPSDSNFELSPYQGTVLNPTSIILLIFENTVGGSHTHIRKVLVEVIDPDTGETILRPATPIPIFSFLDVDWYSDLIKSKIDPNKIDIENSIAVKETFTVVVTTEGNYLLRYEGSLDTFVTSSVPDPDSILPEERARYNALEKEYVRLVARKPEMSFMNFLTTSMNGIGYALYKFDLNGNVTKL
jgi:hypothetical protein